MIKLSDIFIYTLLIGMVFTIVQFVPGLKEKNVKLKTEFFKKMAAEDSGEDSNDIADDDCDDENENLMFLSLSIKSSTAVSNTRYNFSLQSSLYETHLLSIPSPPPKI